MGADAEVMAPLHGHQALDLQLRRHQLGGAEADAAASH
jgi:hypothetical protein